MRLLLTCGATAEDIDAVRFITNRSTGKMGLAIAENAIEKGWHVTVIAGPNSLRFPAAVQLVPIRNAAQMLSAVMEHLAIHDVLIMAAAVADYTPVEYIDEKIKKSDGEWLLRLKRTEDILLHVASHPWRPHMKIIGFSLDKKANETTGWQKLYAKKLDGIVINGTGTFGSDTLDAAKILWHDGRITQFASMEKYAVAKQLLEEVEKK